MLSQLLSILSLLTLALGHPSRQANVATVLVERRNPALRDYFYNTTVYVPINLPAASPELIVDPELLSRFYLLDNVANTSPPVTCTPLFDTVPATPFPTIVGSSFNIFVSAPSPDAADALNRAKLRFQCATKLTGVANAVNPHGNSSIQAAGSPANRSESLGVEKSARAIPKGYDLGRCPPENGPIGAVQVCECYNIGMLSSRSTLINSAHSACLSISAMQFGPGKPDFEVSYPRNEGDWQYGEYVYGVYYRGGSSCDYATRDGYTIERDVCYRAFELMFEGCPINEEDKSEGMWAVDSCFMWVMDPNFFGAGKSTERLPDGDVSPAFGHG